MLLPLAVTTRKEVVQFLAKADHHRAYDCLCLLCLVQVYYFTIHDMLVYLSFVDNYYGSFNNSLD